MQLPILDASARLLLASHSQPGHFRFSITIDQHFAEILQFSSTGGEVVAK